MKELEKSRTVNPEVYSPTKPLSYSAMAAKGDPPVRRKVTPERMSGVQIEQTSPDPDQRVKLACQALAWRKKNVDSMEFVYVEGISRMRYG